ncbi:MAG: hypothetical protein U0Q03_15620 [Acidimicrobiales bacterium]
MRRRVVLALFVSSSVLVACSGGDDSPGGAEVTLAVEGTSVASVPGTEAADTAALTTDPPATDPLSTDPVATTEPASTVPPAEELPTLSFTPQSAGPLQVTASQCTVEGIPDGVPDAAVESFAIDATHAFVPTSGGVAALAFVPGADCSMTLDTSIGDGGLLATSDEVDSVAVSATGRLVASGLFGATVFDVAAGTSYACDQLTGDVDVTADGSQAMTSFPGAPVQQYSLGDTGCGEPTSVVLPADIVDVYLVAYDGADLLIGGQAADDTVYAGRASSGALQWRIGNPETGGAGWLGWVHAIVPCDGGYCIVDTNTDKLIVTDAAGVLRAEFAISELIGERMFYETAELGPDGALYLLATDSAPDGNGGTIEGNDVVRIEVTG